MPAVLPRSLPLLLSLALAACQSGPPASAPLNERLAALRAEQPRLSAREAASRLGTSEAEVLAASTQGTVTRLAEGPDAARTIMRRALDLGEVTAHTRSDNAVLETTGVPTRQADAPASSVGGYVAGPVDLRFDFSVWRHAFAVAVPGRNGSVQRSLQFFDAQGTLLHKLTLKGGSNVQAFDRIVADLPHPAPGSPLAIVPPVPPAAPKADDAVDRAALQEAWAQVSNVHLFGELLERFGVTREQAFRLAPPGAAQRLEPRALRQLLTQSAERGVPLMAFIGNAGVTQIHSGPIHKTAVGGDWFLVLDPGLNLRLRQTEIVRGWRVQRGDITSVEFYDRQGTLVATFFGVRERGQPQSDAWRELARSLPAAS